MPPESLEHLRRAIPARYVPALIKRRLDKFWALPAFREACEKQMHWLLEFTERAPEVPELAYGYAEYAMLRSYLRWHPSAITRQRVEGIEWLTSRRDPERSIEINFMHHARYDGMFKSLARHGVELKVIMSPKILGSDTETAFKQHRRVMAKGLAEIFPATGGTDALATILQPGTSVVIASDVPGQTPVTWLGRKVLGSFGAANMAVMQNSQVVLVTARRDEAGPYLQVHEPLEPADYADAHGLLADILRRHGEAVLAWPEAVEVPWARFGHIEDPVA
jgi:lauroyl/myristoyl acyltransferase